MSLDDTKPFHTPEPKKPTKDIKEKKPKKESKHDPHSADPHERAAYDADQSGEEIEPAPETPATFNPPAAPQVEEEKA